jgi:hypothetical protein
MSVFAEPKSRGDSTHPEMIRRLRLGNLRKLLRDRNGPILPDDDAGREYLIELLLPISVGPHAAIKMSNAIEVWAPWMQQEEAESIIDQINLMPIWDRKPNARKLGERLRVTNGERERLKLWTIAPCDMGQKGMLWWRKKKKRERMRRLRKLRGQLSRSAYLAEHATSKKRPWNALGISRATWYRQCGTSPCQVKLTKAEHQPVSLQNRKVSKESAEKELSVSSIQSTSQSEKPEMLATDAARELLAPTRLTANAVTEQAEAFGLSVAEYLLMMLKSSADLRGMPQDMSRYYKLTGTGRWSDWHKVESP